MSSLMKTVSLRDIAYARSGDKGNSANVGVIAYTFDGFQYLRQTLTTEIVAAWFKELGATGVERFELPSLGALNFVLKGALAGGGSRSLRIDAQGKALAVALLEMPIRIPADLYPTCVRKPVERV